MIPRIETLTEKKLIGNLIRMRLSDNRTGELWRNFMPRQKEIKNRVNADLFSIEIYDQPHFEIMGEKYKLNDPNSEEELWVPIRMKE